MKYLIILMIGFGVVNLNAQKTSNYFQYGFFSEDQFGSLSDYNLINPIKSTDGNSRYYMTLSVNTPRSAMDFSFDSLVLDGRGKSNRQSYKLKSYTDLDQLFFLMKNDSVQWGAVLTPKSVNGKISEFRLINTITSGENLLMYLLVKSDSLNCFDLSGLKLTGVDLNDSFNYVVLKATKSGLISVENILSEKYAPLSKLVWANENKYTLLFQNSSFPYPQLSINRKIPSTGQLPDSVVTAFALQFELGSRTPKNWISGTLPLEMFNYEITNRVEQGNAALLSGVYYSNSVVGDFFPYQPTYKINNQSTVIIKKPYNYSKLKNYIFWMKMDMENWKVDDVQFVHTDNQKVPSIYKSGILKDGFWFLGQFDSIALDAKNLNWEKCNLKGKNQRLSLFTFNSGSKTLNSSTFPDGVLDAYSDGDSLLFLYGDNSELSNGAELVDLDKSSVNKYKIKYGDYVGEFKLNGDLVWARNEKIKPYFSKYSVFFSENGLRFVAPGLLTSLSDLDFGFRQLGKIFISNYSANVLELSKAPICDFDIDTVIYNHVFINYKGALNANYYYKFGDNSSDSNFNQRFFVHSYRKTGDYVVFCIAKNDFGSDTAYYSVKINDIVSTTKLHKNSNIRFYPNPTNQFISWDLTNTQSVEIYNTSGSIVRKESTIESQLNVEDLISGVYIVVVHTSNGSFCNRIIKK